MTNMAMNAAAVYGMCCGIFLSFCMKDPFAGRATCSDSSGLTFIYLSLSIILCTPTSIIRTVSRLLFLQISIAACQSAQGPPCLLAKNLPHRLRWRAYFRSILVLGLVANPRAEK